LFKFELVTWRWQGKTAEHSFCLDFFVSFFVKKKRKIENIRLLNFQNSLVMAENDCTKFKAEAILMAV
jgi:hypothetical protein